jgi:type IV secretory pathway TrbF-like protein
MYHLLDVLYVFIGSLIFFCAFVYVFEKTPIAAIVMNVKQRQLAKEKKKIAKSYEEEVNQIKLQLSKVMEKAVRFHKIDNIIKNHAVRMHSKQFAQGTTLNLYQYMENEPFANYFYREIYTYFLDSFIRSTTTFLEESSKAEDQLAMKKLTEMFALIAREYDEGLLVQEEQENQFKNKVIEKSKQTIEQEFDLERTVYLKNKRVNVDD